MRERLQSEHTWQRNISELNAKIKEMEFKCRDVDSVRKDLKGAEVRFEAMTAQCDQAVYEKVQAQEKFNLKTKELERRLVQIQAEHARVAESWQEEMKAMTEEFEKERAGL